MTSLESAETQEKGTRAMNVSKLLLCTDMDRTIIPNGEQPEHPKARERFRQLAKLPEVQLVYVTGRHLQLLEDALAKYDLPTPDYAITDVGSKIYEQKSGTWSGLNAWNQHIAKDWNGKSHSELADVLGTITNLEMQEADKQSEFKLSYYLALTVNHDHIIREIKRALHTLSVSASVVYSIDEQAKRGLIDVLPKNATKLHAVLFMQEILDYKIEEIIFAGDSGNDLLVLGSHIPSTLVANASQEVREEAIQLAAENETSSALYLAENGPADCVGNYAGGVVQGVLHYIPEMGQLLDIS